MTASWRSIVERGNNSDDIDRAMQRSGNLVVVDVERAGRRLRLKIAPRVLTRSEAQEYAEEYTARSRRVLGIVEQRFTSSRYRRERRLYSAAHPTGPAGASSLR